MTPMPNFLEWLVRRDTFGDRIRKRRAVSRERERAYERNVRMPRITSANRHAWDRRQLAVHGAVPNQEVCALLNLDSRAFLAMKRLSLLPYPLRFRRWMCYSVEQVACLAQALAYASG